MITINPKYDVILTFSPIIEITGHIFECFDYYLCLRKRYNVCIVFFGGIPKESLELAFNSKYCLPFSDIEQDIMVVSHHLFSNTNLLVNVPTKAVVLVTDGNVRGLIYNKIHIMSKHLLGFGCEADRKRTGNKIYDSMTYLQDYRIYGSSGEFRTVDYVKKIPFEYYKDCKRKPIQEDIGLIYMTYVCRKVSPETILEYHRRSSCSKTILLVPYKLPEYDCIENVSQTVAPLDNLFECFDTYIYTPVPRKLDCSPRLLAECFFYNKRIFLDIDYEDKGLEVRLSDCKLGIETITLKDNDNIFYIIETVRNA